MYWRIIPTHVVPMIHRMEMDGFRHHRDVMARLWKTFDQTIKDFNVEKTMRNFERDMDCMRSRARRFEERDGIHNVRSPYVTDEAGNKKLQLCYDVSHYKPEEITVKAVENRLVVNAKQMKEEGGEKWYSEFSREFTLPKDVEVSELKSTLTTDGMLQVEAPVKPEMAEPKAKEIPIEFKTENTNGAKAEGSESYSTVN